jgi:hypothetical protein
MTGNSCLTAMFCSLEGRAELALIAADNVAPVGVHGVRPPLPDSLKIRKTEDSTPTDSHLFLSTVKSSTFRTLTALQVSPAEQPKEEDISTSIGRLSSPSWPSC